MEIYPWKNTCLSTIYFSFREPDIQREVKQRKQSMEMAVESQLMDSLGLNQIFPSILLNPWNNLSFYCIVDIKDTKNDMKTKS